MTTPTTITDPEGAKAYLLQHNIPNLFESMARALVTQRPDRPLEYLLERIATTATEGGAAILCPAAEHTTAVDTAALSTYDGIQKWAAAQAAAIRSNSGSHDAVARATDGCCALLQHTATLFAVIEKEIKAAASKNVNETYPRLGDFSRGVERLLKAADRVIPKTFAGGGGSRFEFAAGAGKEDPGRDLRALSCRGGT